MPSGIATDLRREIHVYRINGKEANASRLQRTVDRLVVTATAMTDT